MYLDKIFPKEIDYAKKNNIPVVIPAGTVEYHGPHCSYGCDTLIAQGLVEKLEQKKELIIAPTISYSPSSYAVADEKSGTVHVEEDTFEAYLFHIQICRPRWSAYRSDALREWREDRSEYRKWSYQRTA